MSNIDVELGNNTEQSATKNLRLKCQKNIDKNHLLQSLESGFISHNQGYHNHLAPSLLVNNHLQGKKILSALTEENEEFHHVNVIKNGILPMIHVEVFYFYEYLANLRKRVS